MAASLDFDFEAFTVKIIKALDELRSYGSNGAKSPIEPRINAFYRALGLPAVLKEDTSKNIDPTNTGNSFKKSTNTDNSFEEGLDYNTYSSYFSIRNQAFKKSTDPSEYRSFLHFRQYKLSNNIGRDQNNARKRGSLFPYAVDGDLEVFPQSKRIATPFEDEDNLVMGNGKDLYMRPLIESIIYIRLKGQGLSNSQNQANIVAEFNKFFGITDEAEGINQDTAWLVAEIIKNFRRAIITSIEKFNLAVKNAGTVTSQSDVVYELFTDNICEQNPAKSDEQVEPGTYDITKLLLQEEEKNRAAFLSLLEFSDDRGSDKKSAVDSSLLSHALSVISAKEVKAVMDINQNDRRTLKAFELAKKSVKTIDAFTGEFSGISGVDILIVITALFEVEMKFLLGLLNKEAATRLKNIKGESASSTESVSKSLEALGEKIDNLYRIVDRELTIPTTDNESNRAGA